MDIGTSTHIPRRTVLRLMIGTLVATACSTAAPAAPTAAPAKPTTAPAAQPTTAPAAQPTTAPAAQPTTAPAAAAKPTTAPASVPAKPVDFGIAVSGEGEMKNGLQMATNFNKVPAGIALESLIKDGVKVNAQYLNESEAPTQALVQGTVQFAQTAFTSAISAIAKGAPLKIIAVDRRPEYVMVTLNSMNKPEDFNGKNVAIHSNVSSVAIMTRLYLANTPNVKPNILVVPGSPNRIQAMLAGQVDASVVQLGDDDGIFAAQPNKWHSIFNYAKEMPDLLDAVLVVRDDFLQQNRPTVVELTKRLIDAHRKANADVAKLAADAKQREVTIPKGATFENHAKRYVEGNVFPNDSGLSDKALTYSIGAAKDAGFIDNVTPNDKAADLTVGADALKALGG